MIAINTFRGGSLIYIHDILLFLKNRKPRNCTADIFVSSISLENLETHVKGDEVITQTNLFNFGNNIKI